MNRMLFVVLLSMTSLLYADPQPFKNLTGDVPVNDVQQGAIQLPLILWGGDLPFLIANGGVDTKPDSIYGKMGLKIKITHGDDPVQQVKEYLSGKSPFLRMPMRMAGLASELLNNDLKTKPIMVLQQTFSAGDHIIFREDESNLENGKVKKPTQLDGLKGTKGCLQAEGPHVDLLEDSLKAAGLTWDDVEIVWVKDITGENGPAEKMRNDPSIKWACVVTPDMIGLCTDLKSVGTGGEGTVKGARVINSTSTMTRSIVDGIFSRADFFKSNKAEVEKITAGYFKACEALLEAKKKYNDGQGSSPEYLGYLKMMQDFYGAEALPTIEEDAHGLVSDAIFVGIPGNESFFTDSGNLNGFIAKQTSAIDLAIKLGYAKSRTGFGTPAWDYKKLSTLAGITYSAPEKNKQKINAEALTFDDETLKDDRILSFEIHFDAEQDTFPADSYGAEFKKIAENASLFGKGVIVIRGHADSTLVLRHWLQAGLQKGVIKREGKSERQGGIGYIYRFQGKQIDFSDMPQLIEAIEKGNFAGADVDPRLTIAEARKLSERRAQAVKEAIAKYTQENGINLDLTQIQPQGVGIREAVVPKPTSAEEAAKNRRVEFVLIRVSSEAVTPEDFDY
jgi:outer membrane protein OmpA-like peptidoglycan-associated protein